MFCGKVERRVQAVVMLKGRALLASSQSPDKAGLPRLSNP